MAFVLPLMLLIVLLRIRSSDSQHTYLFSAGEFSGELGNRSVVDAVCRAAADPDCFVVFAFIAFDGENILELPMPPNEPVWNAATGRVIASGYNAELLLPGAYTEADLFGAWWSGMDSTGQAYPNATCGNWMNGTVCARGAVGRDSVHWYVDSCTQRRKLLCACNGGSAVPTRSPTQSPGSSLPSQAPSRIPTSSVPSKAPTLAPTKTPTIAPTKAPTVSANINIIYPSTITDVGSRPYTDVQADCVTRAPAVPGLIATSCTNPNAFMSHWIDINTTPKRQVLSNDPVYSRTGVLLANSSTAFYANVLENSLSAAGICASDYWSRSNPDGALNYDGENARICENPFGLAPSAEFGAIGSCTSTAVGEVALVGYATCASTRVFLCSCQGTRNLLPF